MKMDHVYWDSMMSSLHFKLKSTFIVVVVCQTPMNLLFFSSYIMDILGDVIQVHEVYVVSFLIL